MKPFLLPLFTLVILLLASSASSSSYSSSSSSSSSPSFSPSSSSSSSVVTRVFYIPHSHQDCGWLYTIDEYYSGYDDGEGHWIPGVGATFDSLVANLQGSSNSHRKFIIVEILFFKMWWDLQPEAIRRVVITMVTSGQIEFVLAGWCMHDEAIVTHEAAILQMTQGHKFVRETFGVVPEYSWQVDPFGASAVTPSHFAMMGFKGHVVSRVDHRIKEQRQRDQTLEFLWRGSRSLSSTRQTIFTHLMDQYSYCTPYFIPGVYFDNPWSMPPVNDSNIGEIADNLVFNIRERAKWFKTPNLLYPWGCDFQFHDSTAMFVNMDMVLEYIRTQPAYSDVMIEYATLSDYFEAVAEAEPAGGWEVLELEDFFPYISTNESNWTGFYSSRSSLKNFGRKCEGVHRAAHVLTAILEAYSLEASDVTLTLADEYLSEFQHHDAITGTHDPDVEILYTEHLLIVEKIAHEVITSSLSQLVSFNSTFPLPEFEMEGDSMLELLEGKTVVLVISNSLAWPLQRVIQIPSPLENIRILDSNGTVLVSQVSDKHEYPLFDFPELVVREWHEFDVAFLAAVPALGYSTYFIEALPSSPKENGRPDSSKTRRPKPEVRESQIQISNEVYGLIFDPKTCLLQGIDLKATNTTLLISEELMDYRSFTDQEKGKCSGWYIFRSENDAAASSLHACTNLEILEGPIFSQVTQSFGNTHQIFRLYQHPAEIIEVLTTIGPVEENSEVISRFTTPWVTHGALFTDAQGYQFHQRKIRLNETLPIPANYYPASSATFIREALTGATDPLQFSLLFDTSHGVASLGEGEVEVMLHRRPMEDDNGGGSRAPMNDSTIYSPKTWLLLQHQRTSTKLLPALTASLNHAPRVSFSTATSPRAWHSRYRTQHSPLKRALPENVSILTLAVEGPGKVLLRLEHLFEIDDDNDPESPISQPAVVDLDLFEGLTLIAFEERSLTTVLSREEADLRRGINTMTTAPGGLSATEILLDPKDIRTFFLEFV